MSIICAVHKNEPLKIVNEAFCATNQHSATYSAVCHKVINLIPDEAKDYQPSDDSLDFHLLFSKPNGLPMYSDNLGLRDMEMGDYRFSIDRDLAEYLFPALVDLHLQR